MLSETAPVARVAVPPRVVPRAAAPGLGRDLAGNAHSQGVGLQRRPRSVFLGGSLGDPDTGRPKIENHQWRALVIRWTHQHSPQGTAGNVWRHFWWS